MSDASSEDFLRVCRELFGVDFPLDRLQGNLTAFVGILQEIKKLRELDLEATHPAVVFDPLAAWRGDDHAG